jgi:hypothetical protein
LCQSSGGCCSWMTFPPFRGLNIIPGWWF